MPKTGSEKWKKKKFCCWKKYLHGLSLFFLKVKKCQGESVKNECMFYF